MLEAETNELETRLANIERQRRIAQGVEQFYGALLAEPTPFDPSINYLAEPEPEPDLAELWASNPARGDGTSLKAHLASLDQNLDAGQNMPATTLNGTAQ